MRRCVAGVSTCAIVYYNSENPHMRERLGLWLASWALRLTGNYQLSNAIAVLPLIPQRRLAIGPEALDQRPSGLLYGSQWVLWSPLPLDD
jgi:hypothetical protein